MPVIKSAKKQMRQALKRRLRNFPLKHEVQTLLRKGLKLIKDGKTDEAVKFLPIAYSVIDMACKKHLLHPNNAARKKSQLALALNQSQKKGGKKAVTEEKAAA